MQALPELLERHPEAHVVLARGCEHLAFEPRALFADLAKAAAENDGVSDAALAALANSARHVRRRQRDDREVAVARYRRDARVTRALVDL